MLLQNVPKDIHGLVASDILREDRQNFRSLEKLMENRVANALEKFVIDSEATIAYLNICKNATSCCLDSELNPLDRIFRIWNAVFVLRIWADFLYESDGYSVKENFISQNAYDCIEVNAICLTRLIMNLRNNGKSNMFKPHLFDSQPCERTFRQLRSMSTMNLTKINFSLHELLHLIERIELQNDIVYEKLANVVKFPRIIINQSENEYELPSDEDIFTTINNALKAAVGTTAKFGMSCDQIKVGKCRSKLPRLRRLSDEPEFVEIEEDESVINRRESFNLLAYNNSDLLGENSKFIEVHEPDGSSKIVLKSSIVWALSDSAGKLSSDRLKRVQETHPQNVDNAKRHKASQKESGTKYTPEESIEHAIFKSNEICIGEWCFFHLDNASASNINLPKECAILSMQ